jgi:hypothetical protein
MPSPSMYVYLDKVRVRETSRRAKIFLRTLILYCSLIIYILNKKWEKYIHVGDQIKTLGKTKQGKNMEKKAWKKIKIGEPKIRLTEVVPKKTP